MNKSSLEKLQKESQQRHRWKRKTKRKTKVKKESAYVRSIRSFDEDMFKEWYEKNHK